MKTRYPVSTAGSGVSSTTDYEQLTPDANGNVTTRRLRDGTTLVYTYDALNRVLTKTPQGEGVVNYSYNLLDQPTQVARPSDGLTQTFVYDGLLRLTSETQTFGSASYQYDLAGRRTRLTWADGFYVSYDYDVTGNMTAVRENGATSGVGVLATYTYDDLGRRTLVTRGNATTTSYAYDPVSRLSSFTHDLAGTASDMTVSFTYNPASQIASTTRSNDSYAWTDAYTVNRPYAVNGLNQTTAAGATALGYDTRGNLTTSDSLAYTYTRENMLKSASGGVSIYYDPLGRISQYDTSSSTRMYYDGGNMIAEVANPSGAILRRFVPGPGTDEPIVWYEGSGTTDRRWLHADERGSVIAVTSASGIATINRYDEYGIPASTNTGRLQYTGQMWLPELGMYSYKARIYSPTLGRFMQTDPIGYGDGMNWYNYVGSDPVNNTDPSGLKADVTVYGYCSAIGYAYLNGMCVGINNFLSTRYPFWGNAIGRLSKTSKPKSQSVRSKPYVCDKLAGNGYDVRNAWSAANADRKTSTNGKTNWNNPIYREGENWLTAASDYFTLPFARTPQIYLHQYEKKLSFSDTTPFSQEALDAGLDGLDHINDTPAQLKDWCNGK